MRVAFLPQVELHKGNPYWRLLQASLEREGVEFVRTEDKLYLQWRWLVENRHRVQVLHLHFLRHHYTVAEDRASVPLLIKFVGKLLLARLLGYGVVWTVHNLYPHERLQPRAVGRLAHLAVAQLATAVIVHCEYARQALATEFHRRRNVHTIVHPNYIGAYPNETSRQEARATLTLPAHERVFLFLGAIRPYKGVERLIESFREIADGRSVLVVAGKPQDSALKEKLKSLVAGDDRIILVPRFIPDADLQAYFNAADLVVLPYDDVLSSGSALLAMSFGCPVVAPSIGCLTELITENSGVLYDPSAPAGLQEALRRCLFLDLAALGQGAYQRATQFTWEAMAKQTLQAYWTHKGARQEARALTQNPSN